ncbi:MAG: hypothetical protein LBN06_07330 [Prevotellaceae bacterium]|jgi:hypothetical protein|nr:hypothetical protein [Prevotellaceae bacterium]
MLGCDHDKTNATQEQLPVLNGNAPEKGDFSNNTLHLNGNAPEWIK